MTKKAELIIARVMQVPRSTGAFQLWCCMQVWVCYNDSEGTVLVIVIVIMNVDRVETLDVIVAVQLLLRLLCSRVK